METTTVYQTDPRDLDETNPYFLTYARNGDWELRVWSTEGFGLPPGPPIERSVVCADLLALRAELGRSRRRARKNGAAS